MLAVRSAFSGEVLRYRGRGIVCPGLFSYSAKKAKRTMKSAATICVAG